MHDIGFMRQDSKHPSRRKTSIFSFCYRSFISGIESYFTDVRLLQIA